jgi:hypothetical protein
MWLWLWLTGVAYSASAEVEREIEDACARLTYRAETDVIPEHDAAERERAGRVVLQLSGLEECAAAIDTPECRQAFTTLLAQPPDAMSRVAIAANLAKAYAVTGDAAKAVDALARPIAALDVARPFVRTVVLGSDQAEQLAVDLAANAPFLQGFARVAARLAAAEGAGEIAVVAVQAAEEQRAGFLPNVARAACEAYPRTEGRLVAHRAMARIVLAYAATYGVAPPSDASSDRCDERRHACKRAKKFTAELLDADFDKPKSVQVLAVDGQAVAEAIAAEPYPAEVKGMITDEAVDCAERAPDPVGSEWWEAIVEVCPIGQLADAVDARNAAWQEQIGALTAHLDGHHGEEMARFDDLERAILDDHPTATKRVCDLDAIAAGHLAATEVIEGRMGVEELVHDHGAELVAQVSGCPEDWRPEFDLAVASVASASTHISFAWLRRAHDDAKAVAQFGSYQTAVCRLISWQEAATTMGHPDHHADWSALRQDCPPGLARTGD